jgi:hypothetical protein
MIAVRGTPPPVKTIAARPHPLSYLHSGEEIAAGRRDAAGLLSITEPIRLAYLPNLDETAREAGRLALMGIAVRMAFQHLYTPHGLAASRTVYDIGQEARCLLKNYPPAESLNDFIVDDEALFLYEKRPSLPEEPPDLEGAPSLATRSLVLKKLIEDRTGKLLEKKLSLSFNVFNPNEHSNFSFDSRRKIIEAKRTVLVNFFYKCMLIVAGNQSRDYQASCLRQTKITISAEKVIANLNDLLGILAYLNNYSSPLIYTLIDRLLINPLTGLPFNINIPF